MTRVGSQRHRGKKIQLTFFSIEYFKLVTDLHFWNIFIMYFGH